MKNIYLSVAALMMAGGAMAQSPFATQQYSFSSTQKHAPNAITTVDNRHAVSADRVDYYLEDFDAMTALDGVGSNWEAVIVSGVVGFELTDVGHANDAGSTFVIPALATSTPTKWILLDSDSDGTSGSSEDVTLTSPVIDLTDGGAVTVPAALKLEFEQFYAGWQSDTLFVAISDDAGATWNEIEIMNNSVGREGRPNPEIVSINVSPYISDPTQVMIRFHWVGNWDYGWQFDNVRIAELPDNDMQIVNVFRGDLVNAVMYSQVPQSQATEFVIGADVRNIGFLDQTNVKFNWEIFDPSMTSIGSGVSSASIASLANGENDTIWVSTGITPTDLGNYTIDFEVIADATDDDLSNNEMTDDYFELTEYVYAADYGSPSAAFYNWAGNDNGAASIGNVYLINADGVIGGIDAQLDNNVAVVDQLIYYVVYKFDGTAYVYEAQTSDYTTTAADEGAMVRLFFDSPVDVLAGDQVLVMAGHYGGDPSAGWEMAGRVAQGAVAGTQADGSTVSLIDPSAPMVRALMLDFTGTEETAINERFDVYPNPADNNINIALTLAESQNTVINVLDISGKIVKTINVGEVNGDRNIQIALDEFTTGVYFIELVNSNGKQVKKFVKK